MAVEIPLELKGLLVRVALAGHVSKGIWAPKGVAMARSPLEKTPRRINPLEHEARENRLHLCGEERICTHRSRKDSRQ